MLDQPDAATMMCNVAPGLATMIPLRPGPRVQKGGAIAVVASLWGVIASGVLITANPALAQSAAASDHRIAEASPSQTGPSDGTRYALRHDLAIDGSIAAATTVTWALMETVLRDPLGPGANCRWCEPPGIDRSVRDSLRWTTPYTAEVLSGVSGFVLAPISAFGLLGLAALDAGRGEDFWLDSLLVVEAVSITMILTNIVKWSFARQRPAVHFMTGGPDFIADTGHNLSFFSGHSSLTFCLATAAGTLASLRNYRLAPLIWAVGLSLAAFTAYARIAADAHYFTDVLVGSAVGAGLGFAIPALFHARRDDAATESAGDFRPRIQITPTAEGGHIAVVGRL